MATPQLSDLEPLLASLNQLKPPGASKGKISTITTLCLQNIQAEQHIAQCFYRALKKAPATHKLGTLYVIDSVIRQWIDHAKKAGQNLEIEGRGEPGTYPAAIKRLNELMPALFEDIVKGLPADQKPKLENMITIWERGSTFPAKMLSEFRSRLSGSTGAQEVSKPTVQTNGTAKEHGPHPGVGQKFMAPIPSRPVTTPVGYPPQQLYDQGFLVKKDESAKVNGMAAANSRPPPQQQQQAPAQQPPQSQQQAPPAQDVNSILAALAGAIPPPPQLAAQNPAAQQQAPPQLPPNFAAFFQNGAVPQQAQPVFSAPPPQQTPQYSQPSFQQAPQGFQPPQGFQLPPWFIGFPPPQPPPSIPQPFAQAPPPPQPPQQQADPLGPLRSILPQNIINDPAKLLQALNLLQDLQKGGLPMEQWGPIIEAFNAQTSSQPTGPANYGQFDDYQRQAGRGRSRSPQRDSGGRRRASPVYGTYEEIAARKAAEEERQGRNGGGNMRGRYRQRSPIRENIRDSPMPLAMNGAPMQPKFIGIDNSLPSENIKVLSRTLFVGGANGSQEEIKQLFERFGRVQTCIANRDKRHAFVKMTTRQHALNAKHGMEALQTQNDRDTMAIARQTKWGVGFGPRECCDYGKGESIIPIHKLTDADVKWLLTAEYGGTGGRQIEGGMVLEEPDIEIGAGVSSKAMSKRVMPDAGPPPQQQERQREQQGKRERDDGGKQGGKWSGGKRNKHHHHHHDRDREEGANYGYSGVTGGGPPPNGMEAYGYVRPEPVAVATPPAVPGFGFSLPSDGGYR